MSVAADAARAVPIEDEVQHRGIKLRRSGREWIGACPRHGGKDRFSINPQKQVFNCRGSEGGGVIDLVMHLDGCDFVRAVAALTGQRAERCHQASTSAEITRQIGRGRASTPDAPLVSQDNLDLADAIWRHTQPLPAEAIAYFNKRNIDIDAVPEHGGLRFHPRHQCIVGRFTTATGNIPRGIWRRPLTGEKPKSLGPMAGCVIRLWPDEAVALGLVLGEGVETTLAAATLITHRGTLLQPAWAACSAGNMESFPVLAGIEALTLLVDNDANNVGQKAAAACCARWTAAGREVTRFTPKHAGDDFNDITLW
jgi:hypothetical protein